MTRGGVPRVGSNLRVLGALAVIQGIVLVAMSALTFGTADRAAEILYAEDFDRAGHVPAWFGPWHFEMYNPGAGPAILCALGLGVIVAGVWCWDGTAGAARWLERACWAASIGTVLLVAMLVPLHAAGRDWPAGTPADHVRRQLLVRIAVGAVVAVSLLPTLVAARRARAPRVHRGDTPWPSS